MKTRFFILFCYVLLTAVLCLHHEPWRDEADNWLMARDASFQSILSISPNAGTPVGWYFILKPFAERGYPFFYQTLINWLIVVTATALLIFQSPFSVLSIAALCFSWFLSFEYSVVARNYGIGLLGLFLFLGTLSLPKKSWWRKFQFLLAWPFLCFSSVHFLALVPGLLAIDYFLREEKPDKYRLPFLYAWLVFVFVLSVWILWPIGNGQMSDSFFQGINLSAWYKAMSMAVFPFASVKGFLAPFAPLIIFWFFNKTNLEQTQRRLIYFMFWAVNGVFIFKYFYPGHRHAGFNWILLVISAWVGLESLKRKNSPLLPQKTFQIAFVFVFLTLFSAPGSIARFRKEIQEPFTDAGKTARFLESAKLLDRPMSCYLTENCTAILVYFSGKKQFWYPGLGKWGTHMFWDRAHGQSREQNPEEAFKEAYKFFSEQGQKDDFIHISGVPINGPKAYGFELVFADSHQAWHRTDEVFYVYKQSQPN